jgi:hypothetical protein
MSNLLNQNQKNKLSHGERLAIARNALNTHKKSDPTPYELVLEQQEQRYNYSFASENDFDDFNEHYQ